MQKIFFCTISVLFGFVFLAAPATSDESTFITIGSGSITGLYHPTGNAIAKLVNTKRQKYGIRITVETSSGSVSNVNAVIRGEMQFGLVQSDKQYQAVNGLSEWSDRGKQSELRAVFSLYHESLTLVAADDTRIETITDLKGKNVSIGYPGSGHRQNAIDALTTVGLDFKKDINAEGLKISEAQDLLLHNLIDAFFYTVGHPSEAIRKITSGTRKVRFASITNVDALLTQHLYYSQSVIPVKEYPGVQNTENVPTIGVKATLVTSAKVPDKIVYAITKEVFDNLASFKKLHHAYSELTPEGMLEGLSAPIHPGAMQYYREVGLVE
jgi:TRAP transporter TAXI family solute receptor